MRSEPLTFDAQKLEECAKEPIHLLGRVQSFGVLLAIDPASFEVRCVSENVEALFGHRPDDVLGRKLSDFVDASHFSAVRDVLTSRARSLDNPLRLSFTAADGSSRACEVSLHASDGLILMELESARDSDEVRAVAIQRHFDLAAALLDQDVQKDSLQTLAERVCSLVREFSGYDRVMVYRFEPDDHGVVIAEDRDESLTPFLGLHYPASDIPSQARELYRQSWLRQIADADDEGARIADARAKAAAPLDLSRAAFRAVSPVHLQYLRNMGVKASLSMSIIDRGSRLWGLIACHHYRGPRSLTAAERIALTNFALVSSSRVTECEWRERERLRADRASALNRLVRDLNEAPDLTEGLVSRPDRVLELFGAHGLAIVDNDSVELAGSTPGESAALVLAQLPHDGAVLAMDCADDWPSAARPEEDGGRPAGFLRVDFGDGLSLILFRDEAVRSVRWAGDPHQPAELDGDRLTPRGSFDVWTESVRGRSEPWDELDLVFADEFRASLVAFVLRRTQELESLNRELQRKNSEIQQFVFTVSHDLKSPLVSIRGFLGLMGNALEAGLFEDAQESAADVDDAAKHMSVLIDDLLAYSRIGRSEEPLEKIDVQRVFEDLVDLHRPQADTLGAVVTIASDVPPCWGFASSFRRAIENLYVNALRYGHDSDEPPRIELGGRRNRGKCEYFVRDEGPGIDPRYHARIFGLFQRIDANHPDGTGLGLASVAKVAEQHRGRAWVDSVVGQGATFWLSVDSRGLSRKGVRR